MHSVITIIIIIRRHRYIYIRLKLTLNRTAATVRVRFIIMRILRRPNNKILFEHFKWSPMNSTCVFSKLGLFFVVGMERRVPNMYLEFLAIKHFVCRSFSRVYMNMVVLQLKVWVRLTRVHVITTRSDRPWAYRKKNRWRYDAIPVRSFTRLFY